MHFEFPFKLIGKSTMTFLLAKILYPLLITTLRYVRSKTREKQPTVLLALLKCAGRPET